MDKKDLETDSALQQTSRPHWPWWRSLVLVVIAAFVFLWAVRPIFGTFFYQDYLDETLRSSTATPEEQLQAVRFSPWFASAEVVSVLETLLRDPAQSELLRTEAVVALGRIGSPAARRVLDTSRYEGPVRSWWRPPRPSAALRLLAQETLRWSNSCGASIRRPKPGTTCSSSPRRGASSGAVPRGRRFASTAL